MVCFDSYFDLEYLDTGLTLIAAFLVIAWVCFLSCDIAGHETPAECDEGC